ncbi:MAG: hypothetical protein WCR67_05800 [Bacilli bacterium]
MTFDETIKKIKSSLNGESLHDVEVLFDAAERYSSSKYKNSINSVITDLLNEITKSTLDEDKVAIAEYINKQSGKKFKNSLLKARGLIVKKKYDKAIDLLNGIEIEVKDSIETAIRENDQPSPIEFRYLYSLMEFVLCKTYFPCKNSLSLPVDYVAFFSLKSQALLLKGDIEEAKYYLRKAYDYNPVCAELSFLACDYSHREKNDISFISNLDKVHRFLYCKDDYTHYLSYIAVYLKEHDPVKFKPFISYVQSKMNAAISYSQIIEELGPETVSEVEALGINLHISEEVMTVLTSEVRRILTFKNKVNLEYYVSLLNELIGLNHYELTETELTIK